MKSVETEALVTPTAKVDPNIRATGTDRDLFLIWSIPEFKNNKTRKGGNCEATSAAFCSL